jgi:hypothetical protein
MGNLDERLGSLPEVPAVKVGYAELRDHIVDVGP